MAAKQKLDQMKLLISVVTPAAGANPASASAYFFFFLGQKESYTELGLSEAECGVDQPTSTELQKGFPITTVGALLKSGQAVRMRANGTRSDGRKVTRSILVARSKVGTALAAVNDGSPTIVEGAPMRLIQPTRRRLV